MLKSSHLLSQLEYPSGNSMTPIRDYQNDYFHIHDDKLPQLNYFHLKKNATLRGNKRNSIRSIKRPASLHLEDLTGPSNKRQYSPLNIDVFKSSLRIKSATEGGNYVGSKFFETVKELYESESQYSEMLALSNTVYRKTLNESHHYRNKIIQEDSHDELLLFGNIETISSISELFSVNIKKLLDRCASKSGSEKEIWDDINSNYSTQISLKSVFDISEAFNLHFLRIKSTYLSYSVTHERQMELFKFIKSSNSKVYQEWYEECLTKAQFIKLEQMLEAPIKRLSEWVEILERLCLQSQNVINPIFCEKLDKTYNQYRDFLNHVQDEISEYNENHMYNYSLTPMEIIQGYSTTIGSKDKPQVLAVANDNDGEISYLDNPISPLFSRTSSRYSGDMSTMQQTIREETHGIAVARNLSDINNFVTSSGLEKLTLNDHLIKFKLVFKNLVNLKKQLTRINYLQLVENNIRYLTIWSSIVNFESENVFQSNATTNLNFLKKQKDELTIWKLTELQTKVIDPIDVMISNCDGANKQLKDLQVLKRDYTDYLKERKAKSYDIKRDIIARHFETLQNILVQELPQLIILINQVTKLVIINYQSVMLKYLTIHSGDSDILLADIKKSKHHSYHGITHIDILEAYSHLKQASKQQVRERWPYQGRANSSRVYRRLFDL